MKLTWSLIPVAAVAMTLAGVAGAKADDVVGSGYQTNPALLQIRYEGDYRPWWRREHRWGYGDYGWRRPWWRRYDRERYGWNDRRDRRDWRDERWR